jgi:hypothetical protein
MDEVNGKLRVPVEELDRAVMVTLSGDDVEMDWNVPYSTMGEGCLVEAWTKS